MMTQNKPWQAIVNNENVSKLAPIENNLAVVKKDTPNKQHAGYAVKFVTTKRYNFDDNGGGYQGL